MAGITQSLVVDVTRKLESDIIFGRLRPLEDLIEDVLMARFGVSRHVVRSALDRLVLKGIVTKAQKRSARVRDYTPTEVREIYGMRSLLEDHAIRTAPLPAPEGIIEDLASLGRAFRREAEGSGDLDLMLQWYDRFHHCLFEICTDATLLEAIRQYTRRSNPIRAYGFGDPDWRRSAVADHRAMIAALAAARREELIGIVAAHRNGPRDRWIALRLQTTPASTAAMPERQPSTGGRDRPVAERRSMARRNRRKSR